MDHSADYHQSEQSELVPEPVRWLMTSNRTKVVIGAVGRSWLWAVGTPGLPSRS